MTCKRLFSCAGLWLLLGLVTLLACAPVPVYTISGTVSGSWQCINAGSSRMPTTIALLPLDWTMPFSPSSPEFTFQEVPDGEYTLVAGCNGLGTSLPGIPVTVAGADVHVDVVLPFPTLPQSDPQSVLAGHSAPIRSLAFSSNGNLLVSASEDGSVIRWDFIGGEQLSTWHHGHTSPDLPLVLSPDGSLLAGIASDGTIKLWDGEKGELLHTLASFSVQPVNLAFSPAGTRLAGWGDDADSQIVVWDTVTGTLLSTLYPGDDLDSPWWARPLLHFLDDERIVWVSMEDRAWMMSWWDVVSGERFDSRPLTANQLEDFLNIRAIDAVPDGTKFAFGVSGFENYGGMLTWETDREQSAVGNYEVGIGRVGFSPDGSMVASTAYDNTVVLWDAVTAVPRHILKNERRGILQFAWSPDGEMLAAGDSAGNILVWEIP